MAEQNVKLLQGLNDAFAQGDVPAVLGKMTDDMEWHEADGMPYPSPQHGPGAVAENIFGPVINDVPDFTVTPKELIANDDQVAVVAQYTGTAKATGTKLDLPVVHIWDIRGDKICRFRQYTDASKFNEVVGTQAAATA